MVNEQPGDNSQSEPGEAAAHQEALSTQPGSGARWVPGKNPDLLPTPSLTPVEFEDFTERLLSAQRFCPAGVRRVVRVERWGRPGDKQDGIDFEGEFSDGRSAAWQCKRLDRLTAADARAAVAATTFTADEYYLVYSGEASSAARAELRKHAGWALLDQRGLGRLLDDLPLHKRRDVLDATWGPEIRRRLMETPGLDAFLSLDTYAASRRDPENILNDLGPAVGRKTESEQLAAALDRAGPYPSVILVTGPGGRGKSRLLTDVLEELQSRQPTVPVVCLAPGRRLTDPALNELPYHPAVIVVEDAHLEPRAIAGLLGYARLVEGTQVLLTSRPSAVDALRAEIVTAGYRPSQHVTVEVGELSVQEARQLVDTLSEGLGLAHGVRSYLAGQAKHSPHVAVIAANMIRRGEFTASLKLDTGLRDQVMGRYQDLVADTIDGFDGDLVRRLLATCTAIGPVTFSDEHLRRRLADFCHLRVDQLLRAVASLHDRGAMVAVGEETRVVPDVLADHVLEQAAAVGGHDTGFVTDIWDTFQASHRHPLVMNLADLDWRLRYKGGPSIIRRILAAIGEEFQTAGYEQLCDTLPGIRNLAYTQPQGLIQLLEPLRQRLDTHEEHLALLRPGEPDPAAVQNPLEAAFGLAPLGPDDVRHLLPPLYAQCAIADPSLLESCLDALWALRRKDSRETNPHTDHAERQIADRLGNLGELPDSTFPARIVERVWTWLAESTEDPPSGVTPLFALRSLLVKQGTRISQQARHELAIHPFLVSPEVMRPTRDAIRAILVDQALGPNLVRAGVAIDLLGEALRPPHGYNNQRLPVEVIHAWADDDLATLECFTDLAGRTTSAVVRRLVRAKVAWAAEHAANLQVRHAALVLVTRLDDLTSLEDELAQTLLGRSQTGRPSRRGIPVPTLEDLREARAEKRRAEAELTEDERRELQSSHIQEQVQADEVAYTALVEGVASWLIALDPPAAIAVIDDTARAMAALVQQQPRRPTLMLLWRSLADMRGDLVSNWATEIANGPPGPLDDELYVLLNAWVARDGDAALNWLRPLADHRPAIRVAIANAFASGGWADRGDEFLAIHTAGTTDEDATTRETFLRNSHDLLRACPTETVEALLLHGISAFSAASVIAAACQYNGIRWGSELSKGDASSVLRLVNRAAEQPNWIEYYSVEQVVAGIARVHPELVLQHLLKMAENGLVVPDHIEGLAEAFDHQAAACVGWIAAQTLLPHPESIPVVMAVVMASGITDRQEQHLIPALASLDEDRLQALLVMLEDVDIWALKRPSLAGAVLDRARALQTSEATEGARSRLNRAMYLTQWGFSNGVSDELIAAREAARLAIDAATDSDLRADYMQALSRAQTQIDELLRRSQLDDD